MMEFAAALAGLSAVLRKAGIPHMVVGGAAVILHGGVRTTMDIDVTVWVPEEGLPRAVAVITKAFPARVPNPLEFARERRVLPVRAAGGVPADIIFGLLPFEEEAIRKAENMEVGGEQVPVCGVADLIIHKVISDRPEDAADVQFLVSRYGATLDRKSLDKQVSALATELSKPAISTRYSDCWRKRQ